MIIVLKPGLTRKEETDVLREIRKLGYQPHVMRGVERTVVGAIGDERTHQSLEMLASWPQVERVMPVQKRYKLVSREAHRITSTITVDGKVIGGKKIQVMAGPCSVEDEKQLLTTAHAVRKAGATFLRGGAYKPRTSPYEFQGLGLKGLKLLAKRAAKPDCPSLPNCFPKPTRNASPNTRTSFKSARGTRRISSCSSLRRKPAGPCCSNAASR